jgi:hypothetical protein
MRCSVLVSYVLSMFLSASVGVGVAVAQERPSPDLEKQVEDIVSLARVAKNLDAIRRFESLPEGTELPLVAMRAVAGCYWRERQFDKSRDLYQKILDRRPSLSKLSKNPVAAPSPLLSKEDSADPETAMGEEADEARAAAAKELARLRKANEQLMKDREALRKKTEAQISSVTASAESSSAALKALQQELDSEKKKRGAAERTSAQAQQKLEAQGRSVQSKVAELEVALSAAREELSGIQTAQSAAVGSIEESWQSEVKTLESALKVARADVDAVEKARKQDVEALQEDLKKLDRSHEQVDTKVLEIQQSHEARALVLTDQVTALEVELESARAALEQSKLDSAAQIAESEARANELGEITASLESQSRSAKADIAEISQSLELARLQNAELSAAQDAVVTKSVQDIEAMEHSALERALVEIGALEAEYAALDVSAGLRQHELLLRIDALEQASVGGESELDEVRKQLAIETSLRKDMQARGETRDAAMLEANRVLAEATEKMAIHFDAIRSKMAGTPELNIGGESETPADLAPLIGKLEAATESATVEVRELRQSLADEQETHARTKATTSVGIASLRQRVELLTDEISVLKTANDEEIQKSMARSEARHAKIQAKHEAALAGLKKQLDGEAAAREAGLRGEIASLESKIKASQDEIELLRLTIAGEKATYTKLASEKDTTEKTLRERIRDLEIAFALPASADAAPAGKDDKGDPVLNAQVDDLYQSIIDTARKDKNLAISQFESLPAESVKSDELLKTVANLYREKREYASAHAIYEALLVRDTGNLYAERKLVMTLFDMGRYDEALERLAGPQERAPEDDEAGEATSDDVDEASEAAQVVSET